MTRAPVLVIDGSGGSVFCGLLDPQNQWRSQVNIEGGPLEKLFPAVDAVFEEADLGLADLGGFYYCEGPGSVLGLRLCAMAIETWVRLYPKAAELYAYNALQLCAHTLLHDSSELEEALIVADWKKGAWNALEIKNGQAGTVEVYDDAALLNWKGPLYHLPQRKGWQAPPPGAHTLCYHPARLSELNSAPALLRRTESVELYNSGVNTFQKWTATRHR